MSIQCKAYLLKENGKDTEEIRSFLVDEGAASSYEYLRKKIATIFPSLGWDEDGSALKLLWKDSSGDLVTFSSDEELICALGEVGQDSVFRIYIKKTAGGQEFPWQQYVSEMLKSLREEGGPARPTPCGAGFSPFHPYAKSRFRGGSCRGRSGCCPGRRYGPAGFDPSQFQDFPGLFAGFWAFNGEEGRKGGCCGKQQTQEKSQTCGPAGKTQEGEGTSKS